MQAHGWNDFLHQTSFELVDGFRSRGATWQLSVASLAFGVELRLPLDDALRPGSTVPLAGVHSKKKNAGVKRGASSSFF